MKTVKAIVTAAVAATAFAASAEVLYWKVADAAFRGLSGAAAPFTYATVRDGTGKTDANVGKATSDDDYYKLYTINPETGTSATTDEYKFLADPNNSTYTYGGEALPFGDIGSDVNTLLFELWGNNGIVGFSFVNRSVWGSALTTPSSLQDSWNGSVYTLSNVVPEPTSGVLLLLGAACLALRRRKRISSTSSRRRHAAALVCALIAVQTVFAAQNDVLVTFSTKGPDKYADGKVVMDGECYALCWSKDFSKFAVKSDGTAEGGEVVLKAPLAKNGRCPSVTFEVDADDAATKYVGGEWAVYLLDTRRFAADGTASVAGAAARSVNTSGLVAKASVGAGSVGSLASGAAAATDVASGVELPKPEITGIKVLDGNVYVTVKGTVPFLAYGLAEGASPDAVTESVGEQKPGRVSADDEVILVAPAKAGGAFFKVAR